MNQYYILQFSVKNLWGYKNYRIPFFKDVNVIIGPNASGKTTLINILYDTLTANISRLCRTDFAEVLINLHAFEVRWSPKIGHRGSLTQTQKNDPNVQETTSAQS